LNNNQKTGHSSDEIDIGQFVRDCIAHWHYFLLTGIVLVIVGVLYIKFTLPVYQASSSIIIQETEQGGQNIEDILSSDLFGTSLSVPTEIGILNSRQVMQKTIDHLGLGIQYVNTSLFPSTPLYPSGPFVVKVDTISNFLNDIPFDVLLNPDGSFVVSTEYDEDKLPAFDFTYNSKLGEKFAHKYFRMALVRNDTIPMPETATSYSFTIRSKHKLTLEMRENLKVEALEKDADIVSVTYNDVVPRRALDVLNTIGKVYIERDIEDKAAVAALTLQFVDQQLLSVGDMLSQNEKDLQDFKEVNRTVDLSEESKAMLVKLNDLDVQRVKNRIEQASIDNLYNYVVNHKDLQDLSPSSLGVPDPVLIEIISRFQELQSKRNSAAYGVRPNSPNLKVLDQQIEETRRSLIENINNIRQRLAITEATLQNQLAQYESSVKKVPEIERELLGISRNFEVNQNIYTYLLQKKAETSIAQATVVSDNKILDPAALAEEPVEPNKKIIGALIVLLAGIIPSIFILVRKAVRTTVFTRDDIAKLTEIPVVGVIGHSPKGSTLAVHQNPKSALTEAFRSIRTNLSFYGLNAGNNVIMVTSSVGGEGKSFVTLNLATVIAMQQKKVVILGNDLRKPKLFQEFNLRNDIGISNYLAGDVSLDDVIRSTNIPGLDLISSGPIPPNPAELLSRKKNADFIAELRSRYDYIVIDTPPLGLVSDALILLPHVDIILYIVRQGYSRLEYIRSLNELFKERNLKNLSIVLNDSDFRNGGYGYGHHYGYIDGGSGYYDEGGATKKRRRSKTKA
jgi:tyrosine-protein kinase Etk/Wzc